MRKTIALSTLTLSFPAMAATHDVFDCVFNLARAPQTQTFRFNQSVIASRTVMNYPSDHINQLIVTETSIPFEGYLGWEKFTAELTYRQAYELNEKGDTLRAAQWHCFRAEVETQDGKYSRSCDDRNERNYPFEENQNRWIPATIKNGLPGWEIGAQLEGTLNASEDTLSLKCTYKETFQSDKAF